MSPPNQLGLPGVGSLHFCPSGEDNHSIGIATSPFLFFLSNEILPNSSLPLPLSPGASSTSASSASSAVTASESGSSSVGLVDLAAKRRDVDVWKRQDGGTGGSQRGGTRAMEIEGARRRYVSCGCGRGRILNSRAEEGPAAAAAMLPPAPPSTKTS